MKAASICSAVGCVNLQPCVLHRREPWASNASRSASERGYDAAWRRLRKRVLAEEPSCRFCGEPSTDVDHELPKSRGGKDARGNLRGLCATCHHRVTGREHGRRAGGVA